MYSSVSDVVHENRLTPEIFGFETPAELESLVERWLGQITDMINRYLGLEAEPVPSPPVLDLAAEMAAGNKAQTVMQRRQSSGVIRVDDWVARVIPAEVLTQPVRDVLAVFSSDTQTQALPFGVLVVPGDRIKSDG